MPSAGPWDEAHATSYRGNAGQKHEVFPLTPVREAFCTDANGSSPGEDAGRSERVSAAPVEEGPAVPRTLWRGAAFAQSSQLCAAAQTRGLWSGRNLPPCALQPCPRRPGQGHGPDDPSTDERARAGWHSHAVGCHPL